MEFRWWVWGVCWLGCGVWIGCGDGTSAEKGGFPSLEEDTAGIGGGADIAGGRGTKTDGNAGPDSSDLPSEDAWIVVDLGGAEDTAHPPDVPEQEADVPDDTGMIEEPEITQEVDTGALEPDSMEDPGADVVISCDGVECQDPSPVVEIAVGDRATCVRRADGSVQCVGYNWWGQLGDGNIQTESLVPQTPIGLPPVQKITSSGNYVCTLDFEQRVWCWGVNQVGQLGLGTESFGEPIPVLMTPVTGVVVDIDAGDKNFGLVTDLGTAYMTGNNVQGGVGNGLDVDVQLPTQVKTNEMLKNVGVGLLFACGVVTSGEVLCWGMNSEGQLAQGGVTKGGEWLPLKAQNIVDAVRVVAGDKYACALRKNKTVKCWGQGKYGQMGDGTTENSYTAGTVPGLDDVAQLSGGGFHICALKENGSVWCWGSNMDGKAGGGNVDKLTVPTHIHLPAAAQHVACGGSHTCAVLVTGEVMCWGSNKYGQLGTGNKQNSLVPIPATVW